MGCYGKETYKKSVGGHGRYRITDRIKDIQLCHSTNVKFRIKAKIFHDE